MSLVNVSRSMVASCVRAFEPIAILTLALTAENGESGVHGAVTLWSMLNPATTETLDHAVCERARLARDPRFDGLFYTAVKTTGIYCRPICPAPTPRTGNVTYFSTASAAAAAGFRPCLRCRPERAPGASVHRARSELVRGALRLIDEGMLDRSAMAALAARVGVGERHLRRMFAEEMGASPLDFAATRRLLFAKQLLSETTLPITSVASVAGYSSLRRFNAAFVDSYGKPPRTFRRAGSAAVTNVYLTLRLPYRAPYDFAAMLAFLARRSIPGVEAVSEYAYRRSIVIDGESSWFEITAMENDDALALRVPVVKPDAIAALVARVRRQFDLDADPHAIASAFSKDRLLSPLQQRWPGQRLPGAWDGFELAVRGVLGQQISVVAARTLAGRLVERYGTAFEDSPDGLHALFPTAMALADAPLEQIGLPKARAATLRGMAQACVDGRVHFSAEQGLDSLVASMVALPGIGPWTAHYVAMRALSQPDAFPAGDLVLRKIAGGDAPMSERALEVLSQSWRPWRAYAVMLLWRSAS